ncbi:MAG TPA: protease modulator HflC [Thermoanaerobaculia bacterium]
MKGTVLVVLALILALLVLSSVFVVDEGQQAIKTRFGEPIGAPITEPGLKWKVPLVDRLYVLEKRFLEWDGRVTNMQTREKQPILVDTYARWRILDPLLFFQRLRTEVQAQARLDGILNGEVRDAVARYDLAELIRTSDREPVQDAVLDSADKLEEIAHGREVIRQEILKNASQRVRQADLGIELLDVQFKRINYVDAVRDSVYQRMIAERNRIADRFRSEGQAEAARIRGTKERELQSIQSEAFRLAQEIIGKADAEATEIYARAYDQSADSRAFYAFLKSMETYGETFDAETWLVLSTSGEFYRYLNGAR